LERKIGEALFRRGEHQQALDHLGRTLAYLGRPLPASRWRVRMAILREIVRQISHRLLPGLSLKQTSGPVDPAVKEECRAYELIAWMAMFTNPECVLLVTLRLLNVSEGSGFPSAGAVGCASMGIILSFLGLPLPAEGYCRRAVAFAEQAQDPSAVAMAYQGLGTHNMVLGDLGAMIESSRQGARVYQEIGDLHGWGNTTRVRAFGLTYRGDLTQALMLSQDIVRLGREGADLQVQCWGLLPQGVALQRLGRLDEAIPVQREALALAKAIPDRASHVVAGGILGQCYLRQGELERALSVLKASQQVYVKQGAVGGWPSMLLHGLAEAYLLAAERSDASQQAEKAGWLKKAGRACQDALKQGKVARLALSEAMVLQGRYEWLRGKPAAAQRWWRRSLALAEEMGQPYDLGMTHLEMGQRLGEHDHLKRAEAIFAEIGAERDLAQAREALKGVPAT
jgi:tetratricopeptide (TPR) repeat protein